MNAVEMTVIGVSAAIIVVAVVVSMRGFGRATAPDGPSAHLEPTDTWLAGAHTVVSEGRRVVRQLAPEIDDTTSEPPIDALVSSDWVRQLDDLTRQLAELSASAPTQMDERVCRSAAIRSRALSSEIRAASEDADNASDPIDAHPHNLAGRHFELANALRDLELHVDLV